MNNSHDEPYVSFVIPVYNEESILRPALAELIGEVDALGFPYEIIVAENGSTDRTSEVASALREQFPQVRAQHGPEPNYGRALREGILHARGRMVVCEEVDLCDVDFLVRALERLETRPVDLVIGSKAMEGAVDRRPLARRLGTRAINRLLRATLGLGGSDTHGLKAFRREKLLPVVRACIVDRDLFASELVIRAERAGLSIEEIPVRVRERRPPTIGLLRRVPGVLRNLVELFIAIRIRGR